MQAHLSREQLAHQITEWADSLVETKQILARAQRLLPNRLREVCSRCRKENSGGKALRRALTDPAYLTHIDEICELSSSFVKTRILWETHLMLFDARR
ncbi:MAG: hypothetical protein HYW48_09800 [Deltaproteobacteria bacterium]|nr:hypothetical protein [Deltaproteobacteria bacterium]